MYSLGQANPRCYVVALFVEVGVREGSVPLAQLSTSFQSAPLLPTSKLGTSGTDSWMGRIVYILGPCGSLQQTLL